MFSGALQVICVYSLKELAHDNVFLEQELTILVSCSGESDFCWRLSLAPPITAPLARLLRYCVNNDSCLAVATARDLPYSVLPFTVLSCSVLPLPSLVICPALYRPPALPCHKLFYSRVVMPSLVLLIPATLVSSVETPPRRPTHPPLTQVPWRSVSSHPLPPPNNS